MFLKNRNLIIIMLKPRIGTFDTIYPLLMELDKKNTEIVYYLPNKKFLNNLNKNIYLKKLFLSFGRIFSFKKIITHGYHKESFINKYLFIIKVLIKLLTNKLDVIYFTEFEGKKNIFYLFNKEFYVRMIQMEITYN